MLNRINAFPTPDTLSTLIFHLLQIGS